MSVPNELFDRGWIRYRGYWTISGLVGCLCFTTRQAEKREAAFRQELERELEKSVDGHWSDPLLKLARHMMRARKGLRARHSDTYGVDYDDVYRAFHYLVDSGDTQSALVPLLKGGVLDG